MHESRLNNIAGQMNRWLGLELQAGDTYQWPVPDSTSMQCAVMLEPSGAAFHDEMLGEFVCGTTPAFRNARRPRIIVLAPILLTELDGFRAPRHSAAYEIHLKRVSLGVALEESLPSVSGCRGPRVFGPMTASGTPPAGCSVVYTRAK